MKLTSIQILPVGFSPLTPYEPPPPPPPPDPDPVDVEGALFVSNYTYSEDGDAISAFYRIDPTTFDILERVEVAEPKSVSASTGKTYRLFQVGYHEGRVYVFVKANSAVTWNGPPTGGDQWALMSFDPGDLTDRVLHGIGSTNGGVQNNLTEDEALRILDGVAYISQAALDEDDIQIMNGGNTVATHFATFGFPVDGGVDVFRNDHGLRSGPSDGAFAQQKSFCFAPDGITTYHVGEIDVFTDPTDRQKIYSGTLADPFDTVIFDASVLGDEYGEIFGIGAVNPDDGHIFFWISDDTPTGPIHSGYYYIIEIDDEGNIIQEIDVTTSEFVVDPNETFPSGAMWIHDGKLYTTTYLKSFPDV